MGFFTNSGGGYYNFSDGSGVPQDEQYHHVVMVYSSSNSSFKAFVDGNIIASESITGLLCTAGSLSQFVLGSQTSEINDGSGSLDAVGVWSRALSDAEVAALYNSGTGLEIPAAPAVKNGWINNIYWINDVATSLDQNGDGTWIGKLYENGSLFSGSKYSLTFVAGVAQPVNIPTETGNDVSVTFGLNEAQEPIIKLVFASITSTGETTVEQFVPTTLPVAIPAKYTVAQTLLAYSIDTTATFSGPINVDFILPYNTTLSVLNTCKVYHIKNDQSVEEMTKVSSDFSTKRITVTITSFSDFIFLAEPPPQSTVKTVRITGKTKFLGKVKIV